VQSTFEVTGIEGNVITGHDLWLLDPATGKLTWADIRSHCPVQRALQRFPFRQSA